MSRRNFVKTALVGLGASALPSIVIAQSAAEQAAQNDWLPAYARAQRYRSRKQSSHDPTGGNADSWPIKAGAEKEIFRADGAGVISHIWFTIAARSAMHLKELVLRAWWDGAA